LRAAWLVWCSEGGLGVWVEVVVVAAVAAVVDPDRVLTNRSRNQGFTALCVVQPKPIVAERNPTRVVCESKGEKKKLIAI